MENKRFKLKLSHAVVVVVVLVFAVAVYNSLAKPGAILSTLSSITGQKANTTTSGDSAALQTTDQSSAPAASDNTQQSDSAKENTGANKNGSTQANSGDSNDTNSSAATGTLTEETFNMLETGMTYQQVSDIIGAPVKLVSEFGTRGTPGRTASYLYRGKSGQKFEAIVVYQASKVADTLLIPLGESAK